MTSVIPNLWRCIYDDTCFNFTDALRLNDMFSLSRSVHIYVSLAIPKLRRGWRRRKFSWKAKSKCMLWACKSCSSNCVLQNVTKIILIIRTAITKYACLQTPSTAVCMKRLRDTFRRDPCKLCDSHVKIITIKVLWNKKVKVKLSRYRPGQALGVPGG
jgi:hypothetical protein